MFPSIETPFLVTLVACLLAAIFISDYKKHILSLLLGVSNQYLHPGNEALFWHRYYSAPIKLTIVLGVLGIQETSCIVITGFLERDTFDLYLTEFDKPWVIHLKENCCCSTNLCYWRPNTVYKNRSVCRYQAIFWRRCRGVESAQ